jgi:hypothetical protein
MRRVTPALALIVGAAIALTATVAVSPSYAADAPRTLPAADTMFALSYGPYYSGPANLHSVDAATAQSIQVGGAPVGDYSFASQPAWDPVTKAAFFISASSPTTERLATMNTSTGELTVVDNFTLEGENFLVDAIAISPAGVAYANSNGELYSLDLKDATLALIGPTKSGMFGFAFNPAGVLYGIDRTTLNADSTTELSRNLYTINTDTGASTLVTTFEFPARETAFSFLSQPNSIQFDSNGILWIAVETRDLEDSITELWSADLTASDIPASATLSGTFNANRRNFYHEALLIVPCPVPTFTSAAEATGTVGNAFTFTTATSDAKGTTFAIAAGKLPIGLVLDAATGIISGTPTSVGTSAFTITATNECGTTKQPFTLAIAAIAVHLPVVSG